MKAQTFKTVHIQTLGYKNPKINEAFDGNRLWNQNGQKKLLTYEQSCKPSMRATFNNGFFAAFLQAYNNHGDAKITPDDVWLTIVLYFSKYVNDNAEQLRGAFVSHEGKKKLVVTTQFTTENQWDQFFPLMLEAVRKNTTEGVTAKLQCNFTTTGRIQKIFSTAAVMNTFKKYFDYGRCMIGCGIQNVHFGGQLQDWNKVNEKLNSLAQFDVNGELKRYIQNVSKILLKFIDTYQGYVDLGFWNSIAIFEESRMSGQSDTYTGWLIHFFGYEGKTDEVKIQSLDFNIEVDNRETGVVKNVTVVGGFSAVSVQGQIYRPHLSMAIRDAPPEVPEVKEVGQVRGQKKKQECEIW